MLAAPPSPSAIESSSGQGTLLYNYNFDSNPSAVTADADSEMDPESLAELLEPDNIRKIIAVYQAACQKASTNPRPPSQINYELEAATLLVEVVLDNYGHLCEKSRHIVDEYIDWDPTPAPPSLSAIESSSRQCTLPHNCDVDSNPSAVIAHADSEMDPESLAELLEPDNIRKIITVYQSACQKASTNPRPPSQINYELEAATLLVEAVLDNYGRLCEESRLIVDEYIDWDPTPAPPSLSVIESSSVRCTLPHNCNVDSNPRGVAAHADLEMDPESLAQFLEPNSVCKIITIYQAACQKASTNPRPPSQINYELEAATLLVEVVLDNYGCLCKESRHVVDEYIDWDPTQSQRTS
ncbi:hypothetical protein H1R20_g11102, partial [Candolleomyces eurysporus]